MPLGRVFNAMKKPVEEKSGGPGGPFWRNKDLGAGWNPERTDRRRTKPHSRPQGACLFFAETGQTA